MTSDVDLAALLPSWVLHLRAERKSGETVELYQRGVTQYLQWQAGQGRDQPYLDRASVAAFVAGLLEAGRQPETARAYLKGLRQYSKWLHSEGELDHDPLRDVTAPKVDTKVVPVLTDEQLHALVKACQGPTLADRRDEALVRFMVETGCRAGECIALTVADVDLVRGQAIVRKGKGGKGRLVPFGPVTGRSLDRYIRLRRTHPRAREAPLWVGERGRAFGYPALARALKLRAARAGIPDFHLHLLRHAFAARWLARGGSEGGLLAVAGWTRRELLDRYVQATRSELAATEARGLDLGDL